MSFRLASRSSVSPWRLVPYRFAFRLVRLALASRAMPPCVSSCRLALAFRLAFRSAFRLSYRSFVLSLRFAFLACPWAMAFDMGTVSSCSPLVLSCRAAIHSVSFFYIPSRCSSCPASRFACRSCVSPCVSSYASRCSSRPASRFHYLPVRNDTAFDMGAVSSCLPLAVSVCVSCLAFRSALAVSVSAFRLVGSLLRFALRAVLRSALYPACSLAQWVMVSMGRRSCLLAAHRMPCLMIMMNLTRRDEWQGGKNNKTRDEKPRRGARRGAGRDDDNETE